MDKNHHRYISCRFFCLVDGTCSYKVPFWVEENVSIGENSPYPYVSKKDGEKCECYRKSSKWVKACRL